MLQHLNGYSIHNITKNERQISKGSHHFDGKRLSLELKNIYTYEEIKAELQWWKVLQNYFQGQAGPSNDPNFFKQMCGLCLAEPKEQKWLMKFRKAGLRRLNLFLMNCTRKEAQTKDVRLLSWCCLSLLYFFYAKSQHQVDECNCFGMRKFDQAKALFRNTMYHILPEKQTEVIKYTVKYMTITAQWNTGENDPFVFQELLSMITKPEILIAKIIKQIETSQREREVREAFDISCTLSAILETVYWDKYLFNHLLHNCFNTFLKIYLLCNIAVPSSCAIENAKFRVVIKTCMRNFISNIKDNKGLVSVMDAIAKCLSDQTIIQEDRVEITELIVFCAQRHCVKLFRESITPDLLNLLLSNLSSSDKVLIMLSHKVFQLLFDRHANLKYFADPVYFFQGRSDFTINYSFSSEDTQFIKTFSSNLFQSIQTCFQQFTRKHDLVQYYSTLCLLLIEVPDPVITINIVHLIVTTQNDILKAKDEMPLFTKAHIHAIFASLMSLICVIHKEEVGALEKYIKEVVRFRTENAPQLLPPLQNKYSVASHHTTEYHHQLYFLEEEILYALQRCWLTKRATGAK